MKIHEYQAKELLRAHGVPVPRGYPAFGVREAVEAAQTLGGKVWVVKAQIHAGGRGKGGGVKVVKSVDDVKAEATRMLGMTLVTHQTGPAGKLVQRLYIEEGTAIARELGDLRLGNTVMLGAISDHLPFPAEVLEQCVLDRFAHKKAAIVELNRRAFAAGRAVSAQAAQEVAA